MKFRELRILRVEMETFAGDRISRVSAFREGIEELLSDSDAVRKLTARELLCLLHWCYVYRPCPPHVVLSCCSKAYQKVEPVE